MSTLVLLTFILFWAVCICATRGRIISVQFFIFASTLSVARQYQINADLDYSIAIAYGSLIFIPLFMSMRRRDYLAPMLSILAFWAAMRLVETESIAMAVSLEPVFYILLASIFLLCSKFALVSIALVGAIYSSVILMYHSDGINQFTVLISNLVYVLMLIYATVDITNGTNKSKAGKSFNFREESAKVA